MKIEDFVQTPEVLSILESAAVVRIDDALRVLEQYKFIPRSAIVEKLLDDCEDPVLEMDGIKRNEKFREIEDKFGIVVEIIAGSELCVYYDFFSPPNKETLELELYKYGINYVALTSWNFDGEVTGHRDCVWDSELIFKRILLEAVNLHATDLHFDVEHVDLEPMYTVKYRCNGELLPLKLFSLTRQLNNAIITSLIEKETDANSLDLNTFSGVTTVANDPLGNGELELRISANKVIAGLHCVIRIQKKDTFKYTIENLGFSKNVQLALHRMTKKRSGIVFFTGAIRTGKNTSAFAMANEMVQSPIKIVSYEYPVEVLMPFSQIDYRGDTNILLNAVRLAKKQDVNVAFVNELPNKEVAFAVQDLVNSSVYVITTMHLDRIWHLPYKLKDYYGDSYRDIISQINAVFNQKMFRVPCLKCQRQHLTADLEEEKMQLLNYFGVHNYRASEGCSSCNNTKIKEGANQPYVEYLVFTQEIKSSLLRCNEPFEMEIIIKDAVFNLEQSLEHTMCKAVGLGHLAVDSLESIL